MAERDWVSAHVFYHDDLDPMLANLVAPLIQELSKAQLADRYFFLRYWDGGYHLRLRVHAEARDHREIRRRIAGRCARFFQERPAPDHVSPEQYVAQAARVARWEGMADYAQHLYPNNSVAFLPYRREHRRYGRGASIEAVEQHFVESSRIALRLVVAGLSDIRRNTAAFSLILLAWFCCQPDLDRLAHMVATPATMDDWLGQLGVPAGRAAALAQYAGQRESLGQLAARMHTLATRAATAPDGGVLIAWARSMSRLRERLDRSRSPFAVADTCAHLVCNRLGVPLAGEAHLRRLAGLTVAELSSPTGCRQGF